MEPPKGWRMGGGRVGRFATRLAVVVVVNVVFLVVLAVVVVAGVEVVVVDADVTGVVVGGRVGSGALVRGAEAKPCSSEATPVQRLTRERGKGDSAEAFAGAGARPERRQLPPLGFKSQSLAVTESWHRAKLCRPALARTARSRWAAAGECPTSSASTYARGMPVFQAS